MKNIVLILVLVLAILFGGKFFIEKQYEKKLDELIAMIAPFMSMRYDKVALGWDGSMSLLGLHMERPDTSETIDIGRILFKSSDRLAAIKGKKVFESGQYPESVSIEIDNIAYDTSLLKINRKSNPKEHCRNFLTTFNYGEINLPRLEGNMSLSVDFHDPLNARFSLYSEDQALSYDIDSVFDASDLMSVAQGDQPYIREVSITSEVDEHFAQQFIGYCAAKFSVEPESFLEKIVASPKYSSNSFGADLGPDFRHALAKYFRGGSRLTMHSKPSKQLQDLKKVQFFKAKDVVRWLNMSVTLEGEKVVIDASGFKQDLEEAAIAKPEAEVYKRSYQRVPVSQIKGLQNMDIQITRNGDRSDVAGELIEVKDDVASVKIFRHGGTMIYKVPVAEIIKLQVYR